LNNQDGGSYVNSEHVTTKRGSRPRVTGILALVAAGSVLLAGCTAGDEGRFYDARGGTNTQRPEPAPKPRDCDKDPRTGDTVEFPDTVDLSGCIWRNETQSIAQVGNTLVLSTTSGRTLTLQAIDIGNGGQLWQSQPIELGDPSAREGDYETLFDNGKYPMVMTRGEVSYIAVATAQHKRASAVEGSSVRTALRFYPLNSSGTVEPRTYTAPVGDFRPSFDANDTARDGDRVLLFKEGDIDEPDKYLVVDPETARGSEFNPKDRFVSELADTPRGVTQDGNVIVGFKQLRDLRATDRFGLRSADGEKLWDSKDHAPDGADPLAGSFIGVRGEYLIAEWAPEGTAETGGVGSTHPAIIAVHDSKTGKVLVASERAEFKNGVDFDNKITRTYLSADGRYLTVGRAVFDLKEKSALKVLPDSLWIEAISPQGVAYGYGNEARPVAYDVVQQKVVWEMTGGEGAALLPVALNDKVAVFNVQGIQLNTEEVPTPIVALPVKAPDQPSPSESEPGDAEQQPGGN
jgi:hypothetical protein